MKTISWLSIGILALALTTTPVFADHGGDGNNNNGGNNNGNNNNGNNNNGNNNNNNNNNNNGNFTSSMVGSMPGATAGGVPSAGAPWTVRQGTASISANGNVSVEISGLLLATGAPANLVGTTGPVIMVAASVVCGGSGGAVGTTSTSGPAPLSGAGNASIENLTMPASCMAPVVLVRIVNPATGVAGSFIAVDGIATNGTAAANNNDNNDN
jgi:hypothetical protein